MNHEERHLQRVAQATGGRLVIHRGLSPGLDGEVIRRHESGKAINRLEFVDLLSAASPTIALARLSHVRSFGFLVHHVFLGEVLGRIGECLGSRARPGDAAEVQALVAAMERGIESGDPETRDLVALCFVRDGARQPFFDRLKPFIGPKLRGCLPGRWRRASQVDQRRP